MALALSVAPLVASAGGAQGDLDSAEQLYDEGVAAFETHDYEGAVDKWTQSYAKLPEDAAGHRNQMVYNIATAQEKAYEVDKDVQHLRQARLLLDSYVDNYKRMYKKTPETKAEVQRANERIRQLDARIEAAERGSASSHAAQGGPSIAFTSGHNPPVDQQRLSHNRRLSTQANKADRMIIAGWAVGGVGALFLLGGIGTAVGGNRADNRNAQFGGIGALVLGAAGVATGGALLGVGFKRKKAAQRGQLVVVPMAGPASGGVGLAGRF